MTAGLNWLGIGNQQPLQHMKDRIEFLLVEAGLARPSPDAEAATNDHRPELLPPGRRILHLKVFRAGRASSAPTRECRKLEGRPTSAATRLFFHAAACRRIIPPAASER